MIEGEFLRGSHDFFLSKQRSKIVIKENDIVIMNYNEAEIPILWPPDAKSWLIGKDSGDGKDWRWEEKGSMEERWWMASLTQWTWVSANSGDSEGHAWKTDVLQFMGLQRARHDLAIEQQQRALSLFTFTHWRRKWQPTPVFLPGESQGWGSLVGCHLWGHTESDTTEAT